MPRASLAMLLVAVTFALFPGAAQAADVGYRGPSYTGTTAPTAEKPQSKLWHHDGSWWASMFDSGSHNFTIHELNWATQTWSNTGVIIDDRSSAKMDVLWSGSKLYVASAGPSTSVGDSTRLYRFSYNSSTRTYSMDSGYPVTPVTGGMEAIVMDRDTTGKLWLTYTRDSKVWVTHTTGTDGSWATPFVLPVAGADNLTTDDISATLSFNGKIGVMWGNQNEDAYYFAIHVDGDPETTWVREVAYSRPEGADDHISIKSIQGDPDGRVFAMVKTSLDAAEDPLNVVLVRKQGGVWDTDNVFGKKQDNETRAIIVLDSQNDQVYGFATAPCCGGGTVYMKKVSINGLLNGNPFGNGLGTPFIESTTDPKINNATSTKQSVTDATGLVVLAGDDSTRRYLHNKVDIGPPDTTPPDTTIDSGPTGTVMTDSATFTFSSNEAGSTFQCRLDGGTWDPCTTPTTYTSLAIGPHTFDVRAIDPSGNVDATPASRTWTVDVPIDTTIDSGPSGTVGQTSASFDFSSNKAGSTFECRLDAGTWDACTSPSTYTGLADGSHTFEVRASEGGETDPTPASRTWTVDSALPLLVAATDDATVRQASATTNYGSATTLEADNSPVEESFVKFDVIGVPAGEDVTSAVLRLYATNGSFNGPEIHVSDTTWSEGTVTWNTKPATPGGLLVDVGSAPVDTWVEYDVTAAVTGNGTYSFGLMPDSSDGIEFSSRDAASNAPELVVQTGITDTTPPETTIDSGPTGTTTTPDATFDFSADETGSTFECRLDAGSWDACTSPHTYTGLANGPHTVDIRATDPAGNTDPTPASRTWTVQVPLETVIDSGPSGTVGDASATFTFSANSAGAAFECSLDAAAFAPCTSPHIETGLADGQHTFEVAATEGGQTDPTPASRTWTVDSSLPLLVTPEADATVRQASPTTNYGSTQNLEADTSPVERAYLKFDITGVQSGQEVTSATLRLYATNGSGNGPEVRETQTSWSENTVTWDTKPADLGGAVADIAAVPIDSWSEWDVTSAVTGNGTVSFAIVPDTSDGVQFNSREAANIPELVLETAVPDVVAPETTIDSGPSGTVTTDSATFDFSANETGSTFECRLDAGSWAACTSPKTYNGLANGSHTFDVRATDAAGNTDATPASRTWTVQVPIETTIDSGPSGTVGVTSATFEFSANAGGATFECSLDGSAMASCTSPQVYTGLADGQHTFDVQASEGGQTDPTPASRTWTIDTALPVVFGPDGDAEVRQANPGTNYGSTQSLDADTSPIKRSYVQFTVSDIPAGTVSTATLRLYATNGSGNGPKIYQTEDPWTEGTVTWNNRPASVGSAVDDVASMPAGQWIEFDVASVVYGNGTYSFAVIPDSSDGVVFSSREGANAPELVLETGGPDTTPPETTIFSGPSGTVGSTTATFGFLSDEAGSTFECRVDAAAWSGCSSPESYVGLSEGAHTFDVRATDAAGNVDPTPATRTWTIDTSQPVVSTFTPTADARVELNNPSSNYGGLGTLVADSSPDTRSFLAFDVAAVSGTVQSATLRLYVSNGSWNGPTVHEVTSAWTENGVTWSSQPTTSGTVLDNAGNVAAGTWLELDVTAAVTGNGTVDFALLPESGDGLFANSKEAPNSVPELVVVSAP